ncbi:response regulator [Pendulispora brunnea]|uniref:Response regulator n=1 Tax=Pendulispora brunnea TaxID=2905690 RepID=A0ABZ2K9S4_9BACT
MGTPAPTIPFEGARVLVVEDEPDSRLLLEALFRTRGAIVKGVSSAREGRTALDAFVPDVIVSNIGLPDEDGYVPKPVELKSLIEIVHELVGASRPC